MIKTPTNKEIAEEMVKQLKKFKKDDEDYMDLIKNNTIKTASHQDLDKMFEKFAENYYNAEKTDVMRYKIMDSLNHVQKDQCCPNPHKYKNIVSNTMKFWSCKNCGADLGNIT